MRNVLTIISLAAMAAIGFEAMAADPDYVVVAAEHQNIENNPQYMDLRPDDVTRHLYLWENTVVGETLTDSPYEGNEYTRLTVNSGWFGLGFISDAPLDLSVFQRKEMVLHFALRTTATCPLQVKLEGGTYPGSAAVNLTGLYDVPRDGEWHVVEIPVSAFQAAGLVWGSYVKSKNYFSLVSEGSVSGQVIDLDYIYFHSGTREDGTPVRIDSIAAENTSKSTASYTANRLRGCQSVRWTYHKNAGNIAIDDVCYSAAHTDTTFIYEGLEATANSLTVTGLERDTEYLYRVRAFTGESLSPYSATIAVTTAADIVEATEHPDTLPLTVYTSGHTAHITGIAERTLIEAYTLTGQTVYSGVCNGDTEIRLPHTGIYIIRATVESNFSIYKVIVR